MRIEIALLVALFLFALWAAYWFGHHRAYEKWRDRFNSQRDSLAQKDARLAQKDAQLAEARAARNALKRECRKLEKQKYEVASELWKLRHPEADAAEEWARDVYLRTGLLI